ncbi:MAG: hypothetical protein PHI27_08110 [Eubacteriales bacterium]|nr:hypothetical protein [Eubacteriales bacterium]MDD3882202.1 hypothetical protein [Eubacteriales bacterium]MDD4512551.1 hypothetical protein [Eubacteriales bacterium]
MKGKHECGEKVYSSGNSARAVIGTAAVISGLILFFICVPFWFVLSLIGLALLIFGILLLTKT